MDIAIDFPGNTRVDAHFGPYSVRTDQPPQNGGEGSAPTPFSTFLASVGTCVGVYVLGFCRVRGIPTEDIRIIEHTIPDPKTGLVGTIHLELQLPASFPEKYRDAVLRAAGECTVKRHFEHPPEILIKVA